MVGKEEFAKAAEPRTERSAVSGSSDPLPALRSVRGSAFSARLAQQQLPSVGQAGPGGGSLVVPAMSGLTAFLRVPQPDFMVRLGWVRVWAAVEGVAAVGC